MADVIDDLELILTRAINYLARILNDLCRRLNENSHRPFNRRSLVRWIAAFMPTPKGPKLRLQTNLATTGQLAMDRWASCGSLLSAFSTSSIPLVEEELNDNIVRYRRGCQDEDLDEEGMFEEPRFLPQLPDGITLTSTPKFFSMSSNSSVASSDLVAKGRLVEMEEELAMLRQQIAMLVMAQESSSFSKIEVETQPRNTTFQTSSVHLTTSHEVLSLDDSGCGSEVLSKRPVLACISEKSLENVAAPPPPPVLYKRSSSDNITFSEQLRQRKKSLLSQDDLTTAYRKTQRERENIPDMSNILKDLRNVKLKAVQRSPGGTPIRRHPEREPTDPSAIIAQALKKKFSRHWGISDSDKENDSNSFNSDFSSSFGNSTVKKAKKKLNMHSDSTESWTPVASPLKVEGLV